jgi:hypothetical protein
VKVKQNETTFKRDKHWYSQGAEPEPKEPHYFGGAGAVTSCGSGGSDSDLDIQHFKNLQTV